MEQIAAAVHGDAGTGKWRGVARHVLNPSGFIGHTADASWNPGSLYTDIAPATVARASKSSADLCIAHGRSTGGSGLYGTIHRRLSYAAGA